MNGDTRTDPTGLLRRPLPASGGVVQAITPADAGWTWVSFEVRRLAAGERHVRPGDARETLVLVLEGAATVVAGDRDLGVLGTRDSVFDGPPPPVVLVAPEQDISVRATTGALLAIAGAPGGDVRRTAVFDPASLLVEPRGSGNTARRIHHLLPPAVEAGRLIAYEVFTPGGNWSSYPPHKHDTEDPPARGPARGALLLSLRAAAGVRTAAGVHGRPHAGRAGGGAATSTWCWCRAATTWSALPPATTATTSTSWPGRTGAWHFTVDPDHAWLMNWDPAVPASA